MTNVKVWNCLDCGEVTDKGMEFCQRCEESYFEEDVDNIFLVK